MTLFKWKLSLCKIRHFSLTNLLICYIKFRYLSLIIHFASSLIPTYAETMKISKDSVACSNIPFLDIAITEGAKTLLGREGIVDYVTYSSISNINCDLDTTSTFSSDVAVIDTAEFQVQHLFIVFKLHMCCFILNATFFNIYFTFW